MITTDCTRLDAGIGPGRYMDSALKMQFIGGPELLSSGRKPCRPIFRPSEGFNLACSESVFHIATANTYDKTTGLTFCQPFRVEAIVNSHSFRRPLFKPVVHFSDSRVGSDHQSRSSKLEMSPQHPTTAAPQLLPQYPPMADLYKASYDNLIDEYATPYSANAQHQTYTLQPSSTQYRSGFSHPPTPSYPSEYTSKDSEETTIEAPRIYRPAPAAKESDPRGFWRKVGPCSATSQTYLKSPHRSCRNLWRVGFMS
jgi:hypothetical protein